MMGESMVESLSPLLILLDEVEAKADRHDTNNELFRGIEREIGFIKDIFLRLERWERDVQNELGEIAKHLDAISEDDDSNDDDNDNDEEEEFGFKLEAVYQKVSSLKAHMTPPLHLPPTTEPSITTLAPPPPVVESSGALEEDLANLSAIIEKASNTMKDCLFSLSIFPANAVMKKRLLIHWWIGEGFCITEEEGEMILDELVCWKLITPIYRAHTSTLGDFSVPTKVRDELIHLATNADHYAFPYEYAHVRLFDREAVEIVGGRNLDRQLTCINVDRHYLKFRRSEFIKMRRIVILHLGRWPIHECSAKHHHIEVDSTEFLDWLGSYFQSLRYLSLQGISRIMELPPSIGRLTNLTFLDLRACHNLEKLPQEITMLINLIYLDVSECCLLDHMPKGLSLLSKLEVLKGFVIGSYISQDPCGLKELSSLKKLKKLSISIRRDSLFAEGEVGELRSLTTLRSLTITWGAGVSGSERGRSRQMRDGMSIFVINNLFPPPYLRKLDLRCFPGYMGLPRWLSPVSLSELKKLYIRGGVFHTLSNPRRVTSQWSVEVLRLRFLNGFDMDEPELLNEFPVLLYLEIHECNKLRSTARRIR